MLLYCLPGNVPPGHANMAAQHVVNMPTNVTPTMYFQHHPGNAFDTLLTTKMSYYEMHFMFLLYLL